MFLLTRFSNLDDSVAYRRLESCENDLDDDGKIKETLQRTLDPYDISEQFCQSLM